MFQENQAETFLKLTLILGLVIFHPCLGAQPAIIGNGGDVLTVEEDIVAPASADWQSTCNSWKSAVTKDVAKRQSKLLNIDCGVPVETSPDGVSSLELTVLVGKGSWTLQTDAFRGRIVKLEQGFPVKLTMESFVRKDTEEVATLTAEMLKDCQTWRDDLLKRFADKNILAISCGILGQKGRAFQESLAALGKAIVAIDQ